MTIIVETGAIVPGAESLCTVAFADDFHSSRGNTLWATLSEAEKEQALRRFTIHAEGRYRGRWKGSRVSIDQPMDWPRYAVIVDGFTLPSTSIPVAIQNAWAMGAFKAASEDMDADITQGVKSVRVGVVEKTFDENSSRVKKYSAIDRLLQSFLRGGESTISLVRA